MIGRKNKLTMMMTSGQLYPPHKMVELEKLFNWL